MTYDARERSVSDSEPVEYFEFTRTTGAVVETWRHVTASENLLFDGELWGALPGLARSDIQQNGEASSMQVTVTLPRETCVADELRGHANTAPIILRILRGQRGLADAEAKSIFRGQVTAPVFEGSVVTLTCQSEESAWSDALCRILYQRQCPHMLYDALCGADPVPRTFAGVITALSADFLDVTVDELDAPPSSTHLDAASIYYQAGSLRFGTDRFFVTQQAGHVLTLQTPLVGAAVDDVLQLTAGCDRTPDGCQNVHDNLPRFGGFVLIPERNPLQGLS